MATHGILGSSRITSLAIDVFPLALPPATPTMYGAMGLPSASYHGWRPASVMIVVRLYERRGCATPPCRRYIELLTCESMEAAPRSSELGVDAHSCVSGPMPVMPRSKRTSQKYPASVQVEVLSMWAIQPVLYMNPHHARHSYLSMNVSQRESCASLQALLVFCVCAPSAGWLVPQLPT